LYEVSERLVDARVVADRLGVPVSWVRESTRSGAMPHVTLGRYKRYDLDDVGHWLEGCKQPGHAIALRSVAPGARR
jgi:excisionase family DNA binding protein